MESNVLQRMKALCKFQPQGPADSYNQGQEVLKYLPALIELCEAQARHIQAQSDLAWANNAPPKSIRRYQMLQGMRERFTRAKKDVEAAVSKLEAALPANETKEQEEG